MKRYFIPVMWLVMALFGATSALAMTASQIKAPPYNHVKQPSCTCDCDNRLIYTQAKVSYKNLIKWSQEAAIASYTYGFGNYNTALKKASQYYTQDGWDSFSEALNKSHNLNIINNNKLLVRAIPIGKPKIELISKKSQPRRWRVELPVLVKYENSQQTVHDSLKITMEVVHEDPNRGVQGLGIDNFVATRVA